MSADSEIAARLISLGNDVELVDPDRPGLPEPWRQVFVASQRGRKDAALKIWADFETRLPTFFPLMRRQLQDVALATVGGLLSVVYYFKTRVYVGGLPLLTRDRLGILDAMPPTLKSFYLGVHDGFGLVASGAWGPLARRNVFSLDDYQWSWLEDSSNPHAYDPLDEKLVIFSNGTRGYLCVDVGKPLDDNAKGLAWMSHEPPREAPLWPLLDAWMEIGLSYDQAP
jgi:hypothetical protein